MLNDVLVLGRLTSCDIIFGGLDRFPQPGKEEFCKNFYVKAGGSANTASALARLGVKAALNTQLGDDMLGTIVYESLKQSGVDMRFVDRIPGYQTCVSAVLSTTAERGFATYVQESSAFKLMSICDSFGSAKYVYTDIVHCLQEPVAQSVAASGALLVVDACWNEEMRLDQAKHVLDKCAIFTANEAEAMILTQKKDPAAALTLLAEYAPIVVVKLGKDGCIAIKQGKLYEAPACKNIVALDTTGAGDLFNSGLLYGVLHDWPFEKSIRLANAAGGLAVSFYGGMSDTFDYNHVMKLYCESF